MNRWAKAKAQLERTLVGERGRAQLGLEFDAPVRFAAITVMQPWAWLIAHAREWPEHVQGKTLENRSRSTSHRGPVLIHVSKRWSRVRETLNELSALGLVGGACPMPSLERMRAQLGQVIAVAELVDCRRVGNPDPHPWAMPGNWGWMLEGAELVRPFGLRGNTGLWYAPPGVAVRRLEQTFLVGGLPPAPHLGLLADPSTGRSSARVGSLIEASRLVLRTGVKMVEDVVELDGRRIFAGELVARAAEEFGDTEAAQWFRRELELRRFARQPSPWALHGLGEQRCDG